MRNLFAKILGNDDAPHTRRIMEEQWVHIPEFPGYMVSDQGAVVTPDGRQLTHSLVQRQIPTIGFRVDGRTVRRGLALLVAEAFLPEPPRPDWNVPISLNGDRTDCRAKNLMWRPRWFAIEYHKERRTEKFPKWTSEIILVETGERYTHINQPAMQYGLLERSILTCLWNPDDWAFPEGYHFVYADED